MSLAKLMADNAITMQFQFVPWSKSRNFKEFAKVGEMSLNWVVLLFAKDRFVLATEYSAGIAHCPSYKGSMKYKTRMLVEFECENGKVGRLSGDYIRPAMNAKPITPNPEHVMESLLLDSEVINYTGFEDWADNLGYDNDSRKAETIYKACLDIGLKMRSGMGENLLMALTEEAQAGTI